jgi:hypothetical protein
MGCVNPLGLGMREYMFFFKKASLVPCLVDLSLHIFQEDGLMLTDAIYVDDVLLTHSHNAKLEWVHDELCFQFDMFILGPFTLYLGA